MVAKESFLIDDSGTILIRFASAPPNASIQSNVGFLGGGMRGSSRFVGLRGSLGNHMLQQRQAFLTDWNCSLLIS